MWVCKQCGYKNSNNPSRICSECGSKREEGSKLILLSWTLPIVLNIGVTIAIMKLVTSSPVFWVPSCIFSWVVGIALQFAGNSKHWVFYIPVMGVILVGQFYFSLVIMFVLGFQP